MCFDIFRAFQIFSKNAICAKWAFSQWLDSKMKG